MSIKPKVKVCCISSLEEANLAISAGATALGLVGQMPSGPGIISDELIHQIANSIPKSISSFLLTSETIPHNIIVHHKKVNTNTIQIVDEVNLGGYIEIRNSLPDVTLVQVIHVIDETSIQKAVDAAKYVDYILLDSGNPDLKVKELGGTGRVHNWEISKTIREEISIPLFLAGGLDIRNVGKAIEYVQPYGLDLCSGIRTKGKLDPKKLFAFFDIVNSY